MRSTITDRPGSCSQSGRYELGRRARAGCPARLMVLVLVLFALIVGCGASSSYLPPPPTQEGDRGDEDAASAQQVSEAELDQQAREALEKLYELLKQERFEEAEDLLSVETRDFLSHASDDQDASEALSSGELKLKGRDPIKISPVEFLIGGNIERVQDAMEGAEQHETTRRRELFVVDPQGDFHRVVMIFEGGKWVLHKTSIQPAN